MSVFLQKVLIFFMSVITAISNFLGVTLYPAKEYKFPEGSAEKIAAEKLFTDYNLPEFKGGKQYGIYESSGNTIIGRYEETTEDDFESYITKLKDSGFEEYDRNTIENNRFITLLRDKTAVYVSYFVRTKTLRIIAEPKGGLCPLTDISTGSYDTLLTGMKGEEVVASEGMGFIIRLKDGSFCIIDGGMGDPDHVDSNKLMNILLSQKPEGTEKPKIAAWIFTHLHGDHIGVFNCFSLDHHDDVIIENFYFNFPKDDETKQSDSPYMLDDTIYRYTQFRKCLSEFYSDVPVVKLHSGNRFKVRNASFEVLYAYDDLYPQTIIDGGMNECSLLLKMTVENQTVLWTGDIQFLATDLVLQEYDEVLKSDILQMAHHGLNGTKAFYSRINPEYAILPVWKGGMSTMFLRDQNQLLAANKNTRQFIVTSCGTWTIKLPYTCMPDAKDRIPTENTVYPAYPDLLG